MALPTGKQPEAQPDHSGNNAALRNTFIDSIARCRTVLDPNSRHPYIRGRGRNAHIRAWLLWENQEPPANMAPHDQVLRAAPIPAGSEFLTTPQLFPKYPWRAHKLRALDGLNRGTYYVTFDSIIRTYGDEADVVMPLDAIQVQLHRHAAKIVWANGAADRLSLTRRASELERTFTADEWVRYSHDHLALLQRLYGLVEPWLDGYTYLLPLVLRRMAGSIRTELTMTAGGVEGRDSELRKALTRLYTFKEEPPVKTWDSYQDFLNSPEWQAKREAVQKRSGGWCESCRVAGVYKRAAHVHHVHYEKPWGQEDTTDLLHLCEEHHRLAHGNVS